MVAPLPEGPLIAVIGTGQAGIATLINTIVDVAYRTPDGAPPTKLVVIDTRDQPRARGDTPYPLGGRNPADLHPFNSDTPPDGFPTFGQFIQEQLPDDPSLRTASTAPTYRQINAFLDYQLELAAISFPDQVTLDVNRGTIREVEQATPDSPAIIHFVDGTSLSVSQVIRAKQPPHLGGVSSSDDGTNSAVHADSAASRADESPLARLRAEAVRALAASSLTFNVAQSHVLVVRGSRYIAIVTLDDPEAVIGDRIDALVSRLEVLKANELWIVTPYTASESLRSRFKLGPVQILDLAQFVALASQLKKE